MTVQTFTSLANDNRASRIQTRLASAKRAFTTRNVDLSLADKLVRSGRRPEAGDLILARVTALGQHRRLENVHGRRGDLYVGDEIIVAYGNRYAPDQFEAYVPDDLGPCHLVAGGGVAAQATCRHAGIKAPTAIEVIGALIGADGRALNLRNFTTAKANSAQSMMARSRPPLVIAVVGSSMNAGKTTTVAGIVHGLTRAGFRVGAAKLTGTGSGGDLWSMRDAGAALAVDFTDAGHASTFKVGADELGQVTQSLLGRLTDDNADIAVVEIADGLLQEETARLVEMGHRQGWFDGFVFAAGDAMGAAFGCRWLIDRQIMPLAISGVVSASPLASREAEGVTGIAIATLEQLRDPVACARIAFSKQPASAAA
jgi:molybdopterin-guanine dinucleotide biosynthesis protein